MTSLSAHQPILLAVFLSFISAHQSHHHVWSFTGEEYPDLCLDPSSSQKREQGWRVSSASIRRGVQESRLHVNVIHTDSQARPSYVLIVSSPQPPANMIENQLQRLSVLLRTAFRGITEVQLEQERCAHLGYSLDKVDSTVHAIVTAYETNLKFTSASDKWSQSSSTGGRGMFASQVRFFVERGMPVQAVLPAFPCKSSNLDKVSGKLPDKGEELALITLKVFVDAVKRVYEQGCKLVIVSDGHVFSDHVFTDDETVNTYNSYLRLMAGTIFDRGEIEFAGLGDLLSLSKHDLDNAKPSTGTAKKSIFITRKTPDAEAGRTILMDIFGQGGSLDDRLGSDVALLGLCRGFARFILEDTQHHFQAGKLSKSRARQSAWDTAKLMILRNEAYSKLVQTCFPAALRFSIHPHDNSGPKFAISLLHPALRGYDDRSMSKANNSMFHIPTPWHNVALQLPLGGYALVKRKVLQELAMSDHQVKPVAVNHPEGMYYRLVVV